MYILTFGFVIQSENSCFLVMFVVKIFKVIHVCESNFKESESSDSTIPVPASKLDHPVGNRTDIVEDIPSQSETISAKVNSTETVMPCDDNVCCPLTQPRQPTAEDATIPPDVTYDWFNPPKCIMNPTRQVCDVLGWYIKHVFQLDFH